MIPLNRTETGKAYFFAGVRDKSISEKHLANLGLVKGAKVQISSGNSRDSYIIQVHQARLAITKELSEQLFFEENYENKQENYLSLDQLKIGSHAEVTKVLGRGAVKRRLMDMGVTRGVSLFIRNVAPLGDPIDIKLRGYELSLRKDEAKCILVRELEG